MLLKLQRFLDDCLKVGARPVVLWLEIIVRTCNNGSPWNFAQSSSAIELDCRSWINALIGTASNNVQLLVPSGIFFLIHLCNYGFRRCGTARGRNFC
jgi:hypothetical protein